MKKIISFFSFLLFTFLCVTHAWALPPCPSDINAFWDNCFGIYEPTSGYHKGDKYIGEWKDDKKHGQGIYYYLADNEFKGDKYIGEFKDDVLHGLGILIFARGDTYEGEFKDNDFDGYGIYIFADGETYEGEFVDGARHGQGKSIFASGDIYEGEWKSDSFHGQGKYTYADGHIQEGIWKDDEFLFENINRPDAQWFAVAESDINDTFYIDLNKITKIDNRVLWWELRDGPDPVADIYFSSLHYYEGDCTFFRYKILSQTLVEGRMGNGKKSINDKPNTEWQNPSPGQIDEIMLEYVCEYIK